MPSKTIKFAPAESPHSAPFSEWLFFRPFSTIGSYSAAEIPLGETISMQLSRRLVIYVITLLAGPTPVFVHAQRVEVEAESLAIRGGWLIDGASE